MSDLSPRAVDRRLLEMAELRRRWIETPKGRQTMRAAVGEARRTAYVALDPDDLDRRIRRMAALRRLCLELAAVGTARPTAPE